MSLVDFVLGKPLASSEERAEQIGPARGIPIFGLDALGSAAYGPEAALTLLIPLGVAGLYYIVPLSGCIILLLAVVYFSYRQTIAAYPSGGGSYIVAHQNLGTFPGLLAAAALLVDYALDAAVGISAGIGAMTSAIPPLDTAHQSPPILVITMQSWTRVNRQALRAAMTLSPDIKVVHVAEEDQRNDFCDRWQEYVEQPARQANLPVPELIHLRSPYRLVITPIVDYVNRLAKEHQDRRIITVIPELMERRWFYWFLHTQRATLLKTRLLMEGNDRISVLNIPWYLKSV